MTEDKKAIRLSKAARECNVGIQTIVEFLHKKGFDVATDPNGKIPHEAYSLLLKEYSSDLSVKKDAEKLALKEKNTPKKTLSIDDIESVREDDMGEPEEPILITDISGVKKPIDLRPEVRKQDKPAEMPERVTPPIRDEEASEAVPEKESSPAAVTTDQPPAAEAPVVPLLPKELQPKVVGKVDLEKLKKPSRPAKKSGAKEKAAKAKPTITEKSVPPAKLHQEQEKQEEQPRETVPSEPAEATAPEIFRPGFKKLQGPKVVDKIELTPEVRKSREQSGSSRKKQDKKRERIKSTSREKVSLAAAPPAEKQDGKKEKKRSPKDQRDRKKPGRSLRSKVDMEDVDKNIRDVNLMMSRGKSKIARYRRDKRDAISQRIKDETEQRELEKSVLKVTEFVSVNEMATMMDVPVVEIISTCMSLGLIVSINQRLDAETMALVAEEFGFTAEFVSAELQEAVREEEDAEEDLVPRPPIVTVMGHVDHGKTKLLDYIRNANVVAGEAGGITQHIGAYSVTLEGGKVITFLDTPGHEAFTAMRARGAQITDIVIIVVAADDGVMPQTREAINHAHAAGVPIIFALNKIDKPTANPDRIREELAAMNFLVEEWGGNYQSQEISAKNGINIDLLLEKILLQAEMLELKANPDKLALGTVLESSLDKGRGFVATVLVKAGTLRTGDMVIAGSCYGNIKAMHNERNQKIRQAGPSMPVLILGLNGPPQAGDRFNVMDSEKEAKDIANRRAQLQREQGLRTQKHITLDEIGRRIAIGNFQELNIIVKGDVDGSVEALSDSLIQLSTEEIQVNIIHKAVGQISESDILLAAASDALVVGFQVRPSATARKLAESEEIDIRLYSIIYDAIEEIKAAMEGMLSPEIKEEIVATVEVRETFRIGKVGSVAGCFVRDGKITRNTRIRVIRDGIVIHTGELGSLKRFKDDVREVSSGYECGLNIENFNDIEVGDIIEGFKTVQVKKTL